MKKTLVSAVVVFLVLVSIGSVWFAWQYSKYDLTATFDGYEQRAPFERGYGLTFPIIRPTTRYALISDIRVANPSFCRAANKDQGYSLAIDDHDLHTILWQPLVRGKTYRFRLAQKSPNPDQKWSVHIN